MGAEIKKTRLAVIVSSDDAGTLPLKIIAPIWDWKSYYEQVPWMVLVEPSAQNGLTKMSAVDTFQVRCVSETHFVRALGALSARTMLALGSALVEVLEITQENAKECRLKNQESDV
jgi:mRNA interferase MazF